MRRTQFIAHTILHSCSFFRHSPLAQSSCSLSLSLRSIPIFLFFCWLQHLCSCLYIPIQLFIISFVLRHNFSFFAVWFFITSSGFSLPHRSLFLHIVWSIGYFFMQFCKCTRTDRNRQIYLDACRCFFLVFCGQSNNVCHQFVGWP